MRNLTARLFCLSALALGISALPAFAYDVTLYDTFSVGKAELKAGAYTVEMQGDKAIFKSGKKSIEVPATLGKSDHTFSDTVFVSQRTKLREIDLGGTQDKIVFAEIGK